MNDSDCVTLTATTGNWEYTTPVYPNEYYDWKWGIPPYYNNKKGDENMRYLYEVILVNPKNDTFVRSEIIARSETSALMQAYRESDFIQPTKSVPFDDLETQCRILMSWKKKKSLEKALETIKKAVE